MDLGGGFEEPAFAFNARVRNKLNDQRGIIRAYLGWEPPIVLYSIKYDEGDMSEWLSQSDIEAVEMPYKCSCLHGGISTVCQCCNDVGRCSNEFCRRVDLENRLELLYQEPEWYWLR